MKSARKCLDSQGECLIAELLDQVLKKFGLPTRTSHELGQMTTQRAIAVMRRDQ